MVQDGVGKRQNPVQWSVILSRVVGCRGGGGGGGGHFFAVYALFTLNALLGIFLPIFLLKMIFITKYLGFELLLQEYN